MTVVEDHVYYVGDLTTLTHNTCSKESQDLADNLIRAGEKPNPGEVAAHVVFRSGWSSRNRYPWVQYMQDMLAQVGIDLNDAENGFFTSSSNYNGTHTDDFIKSLWSAIDAVRGNGPAIEEVLTFAKDAALQGLF